MVRTRPSRLYRRLPSVAPRPVVRVSGTSARVLGDPDIRSIVITRGTARWGVSPSTCEIVTREYESEVFTGDTVNVSLTDEFGTWVRNRTGAAGIGPRFLGRIGKIRYEDQGQRVSDRWQTVTAASWTAQASQSTVSTYTPEGSSAASVVSRLLRAGAMADHIPFSAPGSYDTVAAAVTGSASDHLNAWTADIGLLVQDQRDGRQVLQSLPDRRTAAAAAAANHMAIARHQVLAPANWEQPNESPRRHYSLATIGPAGSTVTLTAGFPFNDLNDSEHLDRTYVKSTTTQLQDYINALHAQGNYRVRLGELRVDIVALLRSDHPYDWQVAGQLLAMNPGDPFTIAGDWPSALEGVYFASGIKESLTPTGWEITLTPDRFDDLMGEGMPIIPARIWDQAGSPWNTAPDTWNDR